MSNYTKLYWLTRLDYIQGLFLFIVVAALMAIIFFYVLRGMSFEYDEDEYNKKYGFIRKIAFPLLISSGLILTFIPSKDDVIMIYAGGKTMDFVQKDSSINKIPAQTTELIYNYLNKAIEESRNK